MKVSIFWKKKTDEGYPRRREVVVDTPVGKETSPLEDAILSIPEICQGSIRCFAPNTRVVYGVIRVEKALHTPPSDVQCIEAIQRAIVTAREEVAENERIFAKEECQRDEEVVAAALTFLAGDAPFLACDTGIGSRLRRVDAELETRVVAEQNRHREEKDPDKKARMSKEEVLLLVESATRIDTGDCIIDGQRFDLTQDNKKNILDVLSTAKKAVLVFNGMLVEF